MLVIRREQLDAFIAANDNELVGLVAAAVKTANALRTSNYGPELLRGMITTGIERARSHGLAKPEDIAAFVAVMFEVAPNFDEQREIKAILDDANFPPSDRFYQLFERASDETWLDAEKRYDDLVWFKTGSA